MIALLMNEVNFERRISLLEPEIFRTVCYKVIKFFHKYPGIFFLKGFLIMREIIASCPKCLQHVCLKRKCIYSMRSKSINLFKYQYRYNSFFNEQFTEYRFQISTHFSICILLIDYESRTRRSIRFSSS